MYNKGQELNEEEPIKYAGITEGIDSQPVFSEVVIKIAFEFSC